MNNGSNDKRVEGAYRLRDGTLDAASFGDDLTRGVVETKEYLAPTVERMVKRGTPRDVAERLTGYDSAPTRAEVQARNVVE